MALPAPLERLGKVQDGELRVGLHLAGAPGVMAAAMVAPPGPAAVAGADCGASGGVGLPHRNGA